VRFGAGQALTRLVWSLNEFARFPAPPPLFIQRTKTTKSSGTSEVSFNP
jgi:hypothetical protein